MYHKILNEAMMELKEEEFRDLYKDEIEREFVRECQIETDMALLITDDYVTSISERLSLYKELDSIEEEVELQRYRLRMIDRFGPVPPQTEELIQTIRLRWAAREIGFEKIVLKNEKMVGYFVSNQDSVYFRSDKFTRVLQFVQKNPSLCRMKEAGEKLSLTFTSIKTIEKALFALKKVLE
jgi:transcription-repair coupling factor (superfamily II helicase)